MPGPLQAAGATAEPSEYAPLTMDRYITGLWTQRSALRDADVPYLYTKFYSASRFDSLIDGINREITSKLTLQRRCGLSVYNSNVFPAINSFYPFKIIQDGAQSIRVMADTASVVYDATAGQQTAIFNKSAGAGKTRFLGVGQQLFMSDGVDNVQWMNPGAWPGAGKTVQPGTLILDPNHNIQMAVGGITMPITSSASDGTFIYLWCDPNSIPEQFPNLQGSVAPSPEVTFAGLTVAAVLNGTSQKVNPISSTLGIFSVEVALAAYDQTDETGTGTTGNGVTGGSIPAFLSAGETTVDGGQQWVCYGPSIIPTGLPAPTGPPVINTTPAPFNARFWMPDSILPSTHAGFYTIFDMNGNLQLAIAGSTVRTGRTYPNFQPYSLSTPVNTPDGGLVWENIGPPGSWVANTVYGPPTRGSVILDSNNNLQIVGPTNTGPTGPVEPTWATNVSGTTVDGGITWVCIGPGALVTTASIQYAFSAHAIDGSVSTASPPCTIVGPIIGLAQGNNTLLSYFEILGQYQQQDYIDQIWIWRTAQGGSTLILEDQVPAILDLGNGHQFIYNERGIPDTSTLGGPSLNALIAAPINHTNDPPQAGSTAPAFHMNRQWVINGNMVNYSGGPDTLVGNPYTSFAPINFFQFPELLTKLVPITLNNGGLLVVGTANLYVILGNGTSTNPFYSTTYMNNIGVLSYDEVEVVGSTLYCFTNNSKVVSLDPSAGYVEVGFPIGDQFLDVTTGNANGGGTVGYAYTPGSCYVAWNERTSGDSGIYVTDGQGVGWFRYSPVASPESGFLWSPRAQIVGGVSAVQNCEVTTGNQRLLVGPKTSGPILMRNTAVFADNGNAYSDSYVTIGSVILCESGEVAEVAHVALKSMRVGDRPVVKMLFGEIAATADVPFEPYEWTCPDPPDLPESQTMYSDRYVMMDGSGVCPKCDNVQVMVQWPVQTTNDELLTHSIYGAKWAERKQQ